MEWTVKHSELKPAIGKKNCQIERIVSNSLQPLHGIQFRNGKIELINNAFDCCSGSGQQFVNDTVYNCSLHLKITQLKKINEGIRYSLKNFNESYLNKFYQLWHDKFFKKFQKIKSEATLCHLNREKGYTIANNDHETAFFLGYLVMAVYWSFQLKSMFVDFNNKHEMQTLNQLMGKDHDIELFVIRNIADLDNSEKSFAFENIIRYCYRAQISLVCQIVPKHPKDIKFKGRGLGQSRLRQLKSSNPLSFLNEDTLSKLDAITESLQI